MIIYPAELQLNKANVSDTEGAFLDLNLLIHNDTVSTKIYDERDDFDFDIVNFPFLDCDVPRFARESSHVNDFNYRNKFFNVKLLKQGYRYHELRIADQRLCFRYIDSKSP